MQPIIGRDKRGRLIRKGMIVLVPEPKEGDVFSQGNWTGTAIGAKRKQTTHAIQYVIVEDAEGDCFDIEPQRLELCDNRWPVHCKEDIDKLPEGLYLGLFHGYENDEERSKEDDWGGNGPVIGPLNGYCHTTYGEHIKFEFLNEEDAKKYNLPKEVVTELPINVNGCVEFEGLQYGDWSVFYHKEKK